MAGGRWEHGPRFSYGGGLNEGLGACVDALWAPWADVLRGGRQTGAGAAKGRGSSWARCPPFLATDPHPAQAPSQPRQPQLGTATLAHSFSTCSPWRPTTEQACLNFTTSPQPPAARPSRQRMSPTTANKLAEGAPPATTESPGAHEPAPLTKENLSRLGQPVKEEGPLRWCMHRQLGTLSPLGHDNHCLLQAQSCPTRLNWNRVSVPMLTVTCERVQRLCLASCWSLSGATCSRPRSSTNRQP